MLKVFNMKNNAYFNLPKDKVHAIDRFLAKGLDLIIMVLIALILQLVWYPLAAFFAILYAFTHDSINKGISPGKKIVGLKVIHNDGEENINLKTSSLRNISFGVFTLFAVIPIFGWILMFLIGIPLLIFEAYLVYSLESGLRLGDVLANTKVIRNKN